MRDRTTRVENDHAPSRYIQNWVDSVTNQNGDDRQQADTRPTRLQNGERRPRSNRNSPDARFRSPQRFNRNQQTDDARERDGPLKAFLTASPTASQKYGRRRRHKTKVDRYEYKAETSAEIKRSAKAKSKRRHSHRRDGATLNQDFKAPNVESERLTLKHGSMPGFLGKGKASEAIDRRGLPDLTFSEMTFLGKKRQLDDARFRGLQAMTAKSKDKGGARDISGYFSDHVGDEDRTIPPQHEVDASAEAESHEDSNEAQNHGITDDPSQRSGGPKEVNAAPVAESIGRSTSPQDEAAIGENHRPNYFKDRSEAYRSAPHATRTVHPRSSVSILTAIRRAPNPDLARALSRQQHRLQTSLDAEQYYSLDDLKKLAGNTDKMKHVGIRSTTHEDEPPYPTEGAVLPGPMQTQASFLLEKRGPLPLTDAEVWSALHETALLSRRPGALLAYADPVLMPQRESMRETTNELRTIPDGRFFAEPVSEPVAARGTWETYRPSIHGYDPQGSYKSADAAIVTSRHGDQWPKNEMDEFDADLLDSIGQPELQLRSPGAQTISEAAIRHRRTALVQQADLVSAQSSWDVQDSGFAIANRGVSREVHTRIQLLRPSQQTEQASPPFSGFKRPRLLY